MAVRKKRNGKSARPSAKPKRKQALTRRKDAPDAISLLKNDHREVEALFSQFEAASGSARKRAIVQKICDALTVHATIEEMIFYPPARAALKCSVQTCSTRLWSSTKASRGGSNC